MTDKLKEAQDKAILDEIMKLPDKLTEDDITIFDEPSSNLSPWTLYIKCDWDKRDQLKKQILANQKLRELIERRRNDYQHIVNLHAENGDLHSLEERTLKELQNLINEAEK